jgi:hypothetical protein
MHPVRSVVALTLTACHLPTENKMSDHELSYYKQHIKDLETELAAAYTFIKGLQEMIRFLEANKQEFNS